MGICLVAIAKNEGRFIAEWLAHHLSLGFDEIIVFDNESTDDTGEILDALALVAPVRRIFWKVSEGASPQVAAYNEVLPTIGQRHEWVAFFDLDEFLVFRDPKFTLRRLLSSLPIDTGAIGINWLTFGSGGIQHSNYPLVRDAFRWGGPRDWGNNAHIKTIARISAIHRMGIHDCLLSNGCYRSPSGEPLTMSRKRGIADRIDHSVAQLHHYQIKSRQDFDEKMKRGRAGKRLNDPSRFRADPEDFFRRLDRNNHRYDDVDFNRSDFLVELNRLVSPIGGH